MRPLLLLILAIRPCTLCPAETPQGWLDIQAVRWKAASIEPRREHEVRRIVDRIMENKARYVAVDDETNVPWYVIAGLHNMESGGSFKHHLHEGSPLIRRTRYVPIGRPKTSTPPFTWEYSAKDALLYDNLDKVDWQSLKLTLYTAERYNGTGYLRYHRDTPSPYLWAGTTVERPGKYVADGKWSSTARSGQIGVGAIWTVMQGMGILNFDRLSD